MVEKNSELDPDLRKYKGRVVFDGRRFRVRDHNGEILMHQELGSYAPSLGAGRSCDAYGLFKENKISRFI